MRLTNTDVHTRYWPDLSADGHTLELAAGESADVDVPADFTDPYLKPAKAKAKPSESKED